MSNTKLNLKDLITSKITTTFFVFAIMSLLAWVYVLPFINVNLVIFDYYKVIELIVIILTFLLMLFTIVKYILSKNKAKPESVVTPKMMVMYTVPAFCAASVISISGDRTYAYKCCIAGFLTIFIAYATFYLINKSFAFYTPVCASFCLAFALLEKWYSGNVTFADKIIVPYPAMLIIIALLVMGTVFASYLVSKKSKTHKFIYVILFSSVALIGLIVRWKVLNYVSLIVIIIEKKAIKFKK